MMFRPGGPARREPLKVLRGFVLGIFLLCLIGIGVELLLLEHYEDFWQRIPLFLMAATIVVLLWHLFHGRIASLRVFQGMMGLFLLSGVGGLILHFRGNVEFELEMHPAATGWELFVNAMMGATPALAPGTMLQLGLLGLAYTYRHPALSNRKNKEISGETE